MIMMKIMSTGREESEYLGSPDAKRRRCLNRMGAPDSERGSPSADPFGLSGMNPSLANPNSQQELSQREVSSAGQPIFSDTASSSTVSSSVLGPFRHLEPDPASLMGGLPSMPSLQPQLLPVAWPSLGFSPSGESSQIDASTLLQLQQILGTAAPPHASYGAPPPSTLLRDILLGGNSSQFSNAMGVDPSAFAFGAGMPPSLLSTASVQPVNSSVEDFIAAQLMRLVPAPAPASYTPALFNQHALGSTLGANSQALGPMSATLEEYSRREAQGAAPGRSYQLPRTAFGLSSHLSSQNEPTATSATAARRLPSSQTRDPVSMFCRSDEDVLSEYQCLLRQQMEFFEASPEDVASSAQGRNRPIQRRQVGIRCVHCAHLAPKRRPRGAVYFPSKLFSVYQSAQNMAVNHFQTRCPSIPDSLNDALADFKEMKCHVHGGGKQYWASTARSLGVVEAENGLEFEKGSRHASGP